jgi:peptidylprolyl isomerase
VCPRRPPAALAAVAVTAVAALLAGCDRAADEEVPVADETDAPDLGERPDVLALLEGEADPPAELDVRDLAVGDGEEAQAGDTVTVHYVGVGWSTREEFDASWERGQPLTFGLGQGQVIEGWDRGVDGMREGGRRLLVIPPDQGYGERGVEGVIAPGETLVFVVDLLEVEAGSTG